MKTKITAYLQEQARIGVPAHRIIEAETVLSSFEGFCYNQEQSNPRHDCVQGGIQYPPKMQERIDRAISLARQGKMVCEKVGKTCSICPTTICTTRTYEYLRPQVDYPKQEAVEPLACLADRKGLSVQFFPRHNPIDIGKWVISIYRSSRNNKVAFKSEVLPYSAAESNARAFLTALPDATTGRGANK